LGGVTPVEKLVFSACVQGVRDAIAEKGRDQIIVTGIEAHVCVQQSVLDLLRDGKGVWVCADAVSSRRAFDCEVALQRMRQAGAVVTTVESVIFELLGQAGTDAFKQVLKIVK
jgi:nicotinamidase-related amidase